MTAKIKLNAASGGGSISIQAPSSSSNNRVIALPDIADGTLVTSQSTLDATKLSGNLPAISGASLTNLPSGGKILQVLQNTKTDASSTSSLTLQDTGLSQAITLTSASNKVLVMYSLYMSVVGGTYSGATQLLRGSSEIFIGDSNGSAIRATSHHWPSHGYTLALQSHTFLDTPGAGTHTYKIQYRAGYAGYSVYIGRPQAGSTSPHAGAVPSSLTLMEVAA